jgi:hypothetical protein
MLLGVPSFGYQSKIGTGKNHTKAQKAADQLADQSGLDLAKKSPST